MGRRYVALQLLRNRHRRQACSLLAVRPAERAELDRAKYYSCAKGGAGVCIV